jgi:hypothetical protein
LHDLKFTVFPPTGRFICPISPVKTGNGRRKKIENEE